MSYTPSYSYVAETLFWYQTRGGDWEDATDETRASYVEQARNVLDAIVSWQAQHRGDGSQRYCFEANDDKDDHFAWAIMDRRMGLDKPLGFVHDPLLAQQIVDDLNRRDCVVKNSG